MRRGKTQLPSWGQFISYGAVGILNTLVDIAAFWSLISFGISAVVANPISFLLGSVNSLLINRAITFRGRLTSSPLLLVGKFGLITVCTLVLSQLALISALQAGMSDMRGKFAAISATLIVGFWLNRAFTFREPKPPMS